MDYVSAPRSGWYGRGHISVVKTNPEGKDVLLATSFDLDGALQTAAAMGGESHGIQVMEGQPQRKTRKWKP